jgi:hypothetical protein
LDGNSNSDAGIFSGPYPRGTPPLLRHDGLDDPRPRCSETRATANTDPRSGGALEQVEIAETFCRLGLPVERAQLDTSV